MIEREFIKKFEKQVKKTIQKYKLATKKDKIIVAMSGGKDSTVVAYLLKKFGFNVHAIHINLLMGKWSEENQKNVEIFCKQFKILLNVYSIRDEIGCAMCYAKSVVQQKTNLKQCTICGVIRRKIINQRSRELKATKVATGHNLDDEAQTILMNFFKGNPSLSLKRGPLTGIIQDKKLITRIKPLYFCKESDIRKYSEIMKFQVLYQRCPCVLGAMRHEIRNKLDEFEKNNPDIKKNIVNSWLEIKKNLLKKVVKGNVNYCKICGEPSANEICKSCQILDKLK